MNITFENIDLTNAGHLSHAASLLNAYAALSPDLLSGVENVRLDISSTVAALKDHAESPVVDTLTLVIYGGTTRTFLETMLGRIQQDGKTTLEDVAREMNISRDTARAYLRNAGRTAAARKVLLPVMPTWNHESGCNEYRATKSADPSASR
jgi:hypothetical protein